MKNKVFEKRKLRLLSAIEENPEEIDNHLILAKFYFINKCYLETIEIYKKLLEYHPKDININYNLAVAYHANKEPKGAKKLYLSVLNLNPTHKGAQEGLLKLTTFK